MSPSTDADSNEPVQLEFCAGRIDDVCLAESVGIARIELNSATALGGLTPSLAMLRRARRYFSGEIIAMLRPREGGFGYSDDEFEQLLEDGQYLLDSGADGFACGFLTPRGAVDAARCERVRTLFRRAVLVFHKAIDDSVSVIESAAVLAELGFDRILTSGGAATATDGATVLRQLVTALEGHVQIVAAGGIRTHNVEQIVSATGCHWVHSAARCRMDDVSATAGRAARGQFPDQPTYGSYEGVDPAELQELQRRVMGLGGGSRSP